MFISHYHHREFGASGLCFPPLMFGACVLANAPRITPVRTKLELCGELFRHIAPPVLVETSDLVGNGGALDFLGEFLNRFEIAPEEIAICHRITPPGGTISPTMLQTTFDDCRHRLGGNHAPRLLAVELNKAGGDSVRSVMRAFYEWKQASPTVATGIALSDWQVVLDIENAAALDFIILTRCYTIMRRPPDLREQLNRLADSGVAIIVAGVFHGKFLVGGNRYDARELNPLDEQDQSLLVWRKSFTALCHGHGITPAHGCIQYLLTTPGVTAVAVNTSHPDRVAENAKHAISPIADSFWQALEEEGLLINRSTF